MTPLLWAVALLVIAIGLMVLEVFLPSGGLLGLMAATATVSAVVTVFYCEGVFTGVMFLFVTLVSVPVAMNFAIKWWPYTPIGRRILNLPPGEEAGIVSVPNYESLQDLVGKHGVAASKMIPSGTITIAGQSYDAISRAGAISQGHPVKVVSVDGTRILVRQLQDSELARPADETGGGGPDVMIPDPFKD